MVSKVEDKNLEVWKLVLGKMSTNCYIVSAKDSKKAIIVDPGDEAEVIVAKVHELGFDVEAILLTHGHFDHIGAAKALKEKFDVKIYALEEEKEILDSASKNLSLYYGSFISLKADVYLRDNEKLKLAGIDIKVIATPGHTIGGACYLLSFNGEELLFSGDTMFAGTYGRFDFPTGSFAQLRKSIIEKILVLDKDLHVYPGHNEDTYIGDEISNYA